MAIPWTAVPCPLDGGEGNRGCYATDLDQYVATGDGVGQAIIASSDAGATWTPQVSPLDLANDVARSLSLGLYIAGGYGATDAIATSEDGFAWVGQGDPFIDDFAQGVWAVAVKEREGSGDPLVMVGSAGSGDIIATFDGITWTLQSSPFSGGGVVYGLAYSHAAGRWVACGLDGSGSPLVAVSDDDGATWTTGTCPFDVLARTVYRDEDNDRWYLLGEDTSTGCPVAISNDGLTWTFLPTPLDDPAHSVVGYGAAVSGGTLVVVAHSELLDNTIIESDDGGATWTLDTSPFDGPFAGGSNANGVFASPLIFVALGKNAGATVSLAIGDVPTTPPPDLPTPHGLKNTWRWVITELNAKQTAFLDRLATNVGIDYILDDSAVMTCDLPSDQADVYQLQTGGDRPAPRVDYGQRLIFGLRREEPIGGPPWKCRYSGIVTILQDQATADEPITHLTAHDAWTWAKTLPVLNPDGSLLGPDGLTYTGKTAAYIVKDLIANAYAWVVATFADPMPWNHQPNDGQHLPIDIDSGHFGSTPIIESINFAQGISVGEAWTQLCQTGTVDILLQPVFAANPGVISILNVYAQAGKPRHAAVFGWDLFPRNLTAVDDLHDGTLIENIAQFWAGNVAAPVPTNDSSIDKFGPYYVQKSYPAPASPSAVGLLALAEITLRKQGKRTIVIDTTPELAPDAFTTYYLGDQVAVWAGRPLPPSGNALRGGIRSDGTLSLRVYGFHVDLADDQQETITNVLLTDPNATL